MRKEEDNHGIDFELPLDKYDRFIDFWCLTPLSAIFQLYHGDQF
jgi:hypothetical protein